MKRFASEAKTRYKQLLIKVKGRKTSVKLVLYYIPSKPYMAGRVVVES